MPDDERTRRRLGDATQSRIDDLASGWTVDPDRSAVVPAEPARAKPKTLPPPPPGSAARRAFEDSQVIALTDQLAAPRAAKPAVNGTGAKPVVEVVANASTRTKPRTSPPPPPRAKAPTGALPVAAAPSATGPHRTQPPAAPRAKPPTGAVPTVAPPGTSGAHRVQPPSSPPPLPPRAKAPTGATPIVAPLVGRPKAVTRPTPIARTKPPTAAPPARTKSGPTETGTFDASGIIGARTPGVERVPPPAPPAPPAPPVDMAVESDLAARGDPTDVTPPRAATPAPVRPARATGPSTVTRLATDDAVPEEPAALAVPLGEFDSFGSTQDLSQLRRAHHDATVQRDPASALLGLVEPAREPTPVPAPVAAPTRAPTPVPVALAPTALPLPERAPSQTEKFERGDPTQTPDQTAVHANTRTAHSPQAKLRTGASLRRKRGIAGDLRYVATVVFGVRRSRRELAKLEAAQAVREQSRRRHLITLGRTAVTAEGFDHPALVASRDELMAAEEERARHAGQVTASDSELMRVRRDREDKAKEHAAAVARLDAELAGIAKQLEPLEKKAAQIGRRAEELRSSLAKIDHKLVQIEANMVLSKTHPKLDKAALQAELVSLKADRQAVQRDEPVLASELDALQPRIASLEAARAEAKKQRAAIDEAERQDQKRTEELLTAIGAKRKVMDRAAADAEAARDLVLLDLGERLYVDRPADMVFELAPIDAIDMELGTGERRMMELREVLSSVDKMKLARGIALLILLLSAIGMAVYWGLYLMP